MDKKIKISKILAEIKVTTKKIFDPFAKKWRDENELFDSDVSGVYGQMRKNNGIE